MPNKKPVHPLREAIVNLNDAAVLWRNSCSDTNVIERIESAADMLNHWMKEQRIIEMKKSSRTGFKFSPDKSLSDSPPNAQRADSGAFACHHFSHVHELQPGQAQDTITNFGHLCDREGWDFENMLRVARNHWLAER